MKFGSYIQLTDLMLEAQEKGTVSRGDNGKKP